jgi:hypothetical protein
MDYLFVGKQSHMTKTATFVCVTFLILTATLGSVVDPIQLVYPDSSHQNLLINENSLKYLEALDKPLAIVSSMY